MAAVGGAGALTLSGAHTFTGGLTVNSGTMSFAGNGNLGASPAAVILNGGGSAGCIVPIREIVEVEGWVDAAWTLGIAVATPMATG